MMVKPTDPDFPEAQNLLGVIKSQQGQHDSAIAPLQIGYQKGLEAEKPAKFQDAVLINMARAYFGAKNYPQASVYYEQIPRKPLLIGWMHSSNVLGHISTWVT